MFDSLLTLLALSMPTDPLPPLRHHPHDIIDCVELSPDYGRDRTLFATSNGTINLVVRSSDGGVTWRDSRSGVTGRCVDAIALDPGFGKNGRAWAALGEDGLVASDDGGVSWRVIPSGGTARVLALGMPRTDATGDRAGLPTLYVGGSHGLHSMLADGSLPVPIAPSIFTKHPPTELAITADDTLFVATDNSRLWRLDRGRRITRVARLEAVRKIAPSPAFATDRTVFVATFGRGVWVSRDAGDTFTPMNDGLDDPFVNDLAVPRRFPECRELFAVTKDAGLYRFVDGSNRWELTTFAVLERTYQTSNHHLQVRLAADYPTTPDVIVGTFEGLFVSNDRAVFTSGYGMLLSTSDDAGENWRFGARDVRALSTYALSVAPTWRDEGLIVLGINEGIWRSRDRGASFAKVDLPPHHRLDGPRRDHDIFQVAFSPAFQEDRTCAAISFGGVYVSNDAAESFVTTAPPCAWLKAIAFSPLFPADRTIFVGGESVHRSTDGGATFESATLREPIDGLLTARDFGSSRQLFAISRDSGVFRSDDGGQRWTKANHGLDGHRPSAIAETVDEASRPTLFLATLGGGLFISHDRGTTWQRHGTRDHLLQHVLSIAISPAFKDDGTLFIGTLDGVWRSRDRGATFTLCTRQEVYDDNREPWQARGGTWSNWGRPEAFCMTAHFARAPGAEMELPFVGDGVKLLMMRGPELGISEVLLDGAVVARIDHYAPERQGAVPAFESANLPFGFHRIVVRVTGEKNAASSGVLIGVDAAEVSCTAPELKSAR